MIHNNLVLLGTAPTGCFQILVDSRGRCQFHPNVVMRKKSMMRGWKTILPICPECNRAAVNEMKRQSNQSCRSQRYHYDTPKTIAIDERPFHSDTDSVSTEDSSESLIGTNPVIDWNHEAIQLATVENPSSSSAATKSRSTAAAMSKTLRRSSSAGTSLPSKSNKSDPPAANESHARRAGRQANLVLIAPAQKSDPDGISAKNINRRYDDMLTRDPISSSTRSKKSDPDGLMPEEVQYFRLPSTSSQSSAKESLSEERSSGSSANQDQDDVGTLVSESQPCIFVPISQRQSDVLSTCSSISESCGSSVAKSYVIENNVAGSVFVCGMPFTLPSAPNQSGKYTGQINEETKLPHGLGSFISNGKVLSGIWRKGYMSDSFSQSDGRRESRRSQDETPLKRNGTSLEKE